ncbi:MAG: hypothetical protein ACI4ST_02515 [Candidatus Gallimonas sp.]
MRKILGKLIALAVIAAVVGAGALVDFLIARSYSIDFLSVERLSSEEFFDENGDPLPSDWGVADGATRMAITVRVTRGGKPASGHTLYVKTNRNVLERTITDEDGRAVIEYRCYRGGKGSIAPVTVTVRDESNSVFVFVPAEEQYVINMAPPPSEPSGSGMTTNDIFYEIGTEGEE